MIATRLLLALAIFSCVNAKDLWEFDEEFDETASTKVESTKSGVLLLDYKNLELGQTEAPFVIVAMAAGDEDSKKAALAVLEETAALVAKSGTTGTHLAMVDGSHGVAQAYGVNLQMLVKGPVFLVMDNGNIFTYVWSTSAEGLANFVVRKNTPACQVLDDASAVEKFVKDNAKAAIAFYQGVAFDTFEAFEAYVNPQALNALHIPCAITKTSAAAGKYKKDSDSVTVFNGGKAVSRTTTELGELKDFIATYARSTVLTWGNNPWEEFLVADYQHLFLLADTAAAGYAEQLKEFTAAAETYISNEDGKKAKLVFGVIPMEANHELIWSEYHLLPTDGATLRFFNRPTKDFRQLPAGESITAASVAAFADGSLAGTSQKMPEKITSQKPREGHAPEEGSAISIVTAVDFHSFVAVEKDTILEFYAPWCGHCKKVAPEYEKLATNFAAIDSLQFGKIDGSKNDVNKMTDGIQIKGYPTFLLFPARAKNNVLRLSAQSSLETLTDFVREGAMIQFEYEGVTFGTGEAGDLSSQISDDELDEL